MAFMAWLSADFVNSTAVTHAIMVDASRLRV